MRKLLSLIILVIFLYGCIKKSIPPCNCCETAYAQIDDALGCIAKNPQKTSNDNRLLLLAVTNSNEKSWNLIGDPEVVTFAKRNYLLVVLDVDGFNGYDDVTPELKNLIKKYEEEELFYIVVNQALYPFRDWDGKESKERIIRELLVGDGS